MACSNAGRPALVLLRQLNLDAVHAFATVRPARAIGASASLIRRSPNCTQHEVNANIANIAKASFRPQPWNYHAIAGLGAVSLVTAIMTASASSDYQAPSSTTPPIKVSVANNTPSIIVEKDSGVEFPTKLPLSTRTLIGASVRMMRQLVQVYSIGLYIDNDNDSLKNQLRPWNQFNASDLFSNADGVWDLLCKPDTPKTMRLVVVRSVSGKHMGDGFRRALATRVAQYASSHGGISPSQVKKKMDEFCSSFNRVGLMKQGSIADISISTDASGQTVVKLIVDGRCIAVIQDKALAWALSDMYLGPKSVVSGMRQAVATGLEQLLKH